MTDGFIEQASKGISTYVLTSKAAQSNCHLPQILLESPLIALHPSHVNSMLLMSTKL